MFLFKSRTASTRTIFRRLGAVTVGAALVLAPAASAYAFDLPFDMYDVDNNGSIDSGVADVSGPAGGSDGILDQNFIDVYPRDGQGDVWLIDKNQDRVVDEFAGDINGDLRPDYWLVDNDQRNGFEQLWADTDHDEVPDTPSTLSVPLPTAPTGVDLVITPPKWGGLGDIADALQASQSQPCVKFLWTMPAGFMCG